MRLRNAWFHSFLTAALWALLVCGSVDAAGNMTSEPGRTYQYDAENRIKSVNNGSVAVYQYDADGRRSVKNSASGTRIYFYDIEGRPIAESGPTQGGWLSGRAYFQDRHVFENTGVQFLWRHTDHLGTAVVRTDSNGGKICDSRFYPYGEEFTAPCAGDPYKFTGKERDSETGLDYFGARYYGNHYGRFTSVDPALESGRQEDPQRWNRYAYTRNNPLIYVDPDGKDFVDFLIGVSNGLSSSIALNLNRIDAQSKNRDFQAGQVVGDALAAATGALVMYAGAGGVGGGAALSVSGAGAVAGVPAIIASAGLLASGATTVTIGSSNAILGGANLFFSTPGSYAPDRQLPRDPASGRPIPESENPHTQLGQRTSRHRGETYTQGREFGTGGRHIRDVDFTNHGRRDHPNPHQHRIDPKTGRRLEPEPLGKN